MFLKYHNSHLECETQFINNITSYNVICDFHKNNQKNERIKIMWLSKPKTTQTRFGCYLSDNIKLATS